MRGSVEIYRGNELLLKEDNLIVDGAGELIALLMTISPDLAGIPSASAILDASNFVPHAVSFGKDVSAFFENGHSDSVYSVSGRAMRQVFVDSTADTDIGGEGSYAPNLYYPPAPTPVDRTLSLPASSFDKFGQNSNLLVYGTQVCSYTQQQAIQHGCYPPASGMNIRLVSSIGAYIDASSILNRTPSSLFNLVSSMDYRGFVKYVSGATDPASGLILSSVSTFSSTGEVIYQVSVGSGDAAMANVFGGCTLMGLWALDVEQLLENGRTPPYSFHPTTNVLEYKLFAKKGFAVNIFRCNDVGINYGIRNHQQLNIIWRLFFI
jgi:hypothetical protein